MSALEFLEKIPVAHELRHLTDMCSSQSTKSRKTKERTRERERERAHNEQLRVLDECFIVPTKMEWCQFTCMTHEDPIRSRVPNLT